MREVMELRDYQISTSDSACKCLQDHGLVYLAMEVRTGKTITAFETVRKYGAKNVLFVTKLKAIGSIQEDYKHYIPYFNLTVINFESVSKMVGRFDLLIVDESHSLGTFPKPSKRVKDLLKFSKDIPIIHLSGTPSPESYSQIYHQFYISSFSPFKEYRNFYKWASVFVDKKIKHLYGREINDYSGARIADIEPMIKHLFFTQTQGDSGFEQTIREEFITVPMSEVQRVMIDKLMKDKVLTGKSGSVVLADTAVKLQSKIHQICSGTVKDEDGVGHIISTAKSDAIKLAFQGKKIAIYYQFKAEFEALKSVFPNWTDSPEQFQAGTDITFLGQFVSAREGIRLDTADAIVFYNIAFSFLSYEQSRNRIVSKEREKDAVLYWVFAEGGIEQKVYRVVCKKKDYTAYYFKQDYHVGKQVSKQTYPAVHQAGLVLH